MASNTLAAVALTLTLTLATLFSYATPTFVCPWCPPAPPPPSATCPIDALKFGVCVNVLDGLINGTLGNTPDRKCCPLIKGLVDVEAIACLCVALKLNVFGTHHLVPLYLPLLLNHCGKQSSNFKCPQA